MESGEKGEATLGSSVVSEGTFVRVSANILKVQF